MEIAFGEANYCTNGYNEDPENERDAAIKSIINDLEKDVASLFGTDTTSQSLGQNLLRLLDGEKAQEGSSIQLTLTECTIGMTEDRELVHEIRYVITGTNPNPDIIIPPLN